MFNLWNKTYVQTFNERSIFDTKTILADPQWAAVTFDPSSFKGDGSIISQGWDLDDVISKRYDGQYSNFLIELISARQFKWSIVVGHGDRYRLLACFISELQHTYKLSDGDRDLLAFSYLYDDFYYSDDQSIARGFKSGDFQQIVATTFREYKPTGALDFIDPSAFATEIAIFLVKRGVIGETPLIPKLVNACELLITKLWYAHQNDWSERLVLDTVPFLNAMRDSQTPPITNSTFSLSDMLTYVQGDVQLNSMLSAPFPFFDNWADTAAGRDAAELVLKTWELLIDFVVSKGETDPEFAKRPQYVEIAAQRESTTALIAAVRHLLQLGDSPVDVSPIDALTYDVLSDNMDNKYNKTLMLLTMQGMSSTFQGFIDSAFKLEDKSERPQ